MIRVLAALVMIYSASIVVAGERPAEIDSYEAAFHTTLHDGPEFYLVCITQADKKPWRGEWEQLFIKATIVEVIRGEKKVGEKIEYNRVLDGKYGDISSLHGSLYFVRFDIDDETKVIGVDPQDPQALFSYSEEFHAQAIEHKNKENKAEEPDAEPAV